MAKAQSTYIEPGYDWGSPAPAPELPSQNAASNTQDSTQEGSRVRLDVAAVQTQDGSSVLDKKFWDKVKELVHSAEEVPESEHPPPVYKPRWREMRSREPPLVRMVGAEDHSDYITVAKEIASRFPHPHLNAQ